MRKTTRTALAFALGLGIAGSALAQSEASDPVKAEPAAPTPAPAGSLEYQKFKGIGSQAELEERRARIAKKRDEMRERRDRRMAQQIERLKERANKLRSQAAGKSNELDKDSLEREAQRLDQKVSVMQERQERFTQNAQLARATGDRPPSSNKLDPTLSREQRAKIRKAQMRRRWGQVLGRDEVTQELKVHAERAAKLRRIRTLAKDSNKDDLVQRSNKLLALEQQRHLKKMQSFEKDEAGATPTAPNEPAAVQAPAQPAPAGEETK